MFKKYKKSYLVINVILTVLFIFLCMNVFIFKKTSYIFLTITLLIPTIFFILFYGYEKKSRRFKYELSFYVFVYSALFLLITYILGLYLGFTSNVYKLNFSNLIHNIIPYFILILVSEVLRYEISRKGDGSILSFVLVSLILVLIDLNLFRNVYDLSTGDGQIKYICVVAIPSLFKNIILLYFTKNGGVCPSLVYRILFDLKLVVVPIFPQFGAYFECIISTIIPVLMAYIIHFNLKKFEDEDEYIDIKKSKKYKYIAFALVLGLVITVNIFASCMFKYGLIAIGSNSMAPIFSKGDAIIYERLSDNIIPEVGQIIIFKKDNKMIVHRIVKTIDIGDNEKIYYTKGDANEKADGYPIERKSILGIYKMGIKYLGYPSVALGELIHN